MKENFVFFDIETTGLKSEENRITCIGLYSSYFGSVQFSSLSEARLLNAFMDFFNKYDLNEFEWVSFNGKEFDFPFLINRINLVIGVEDELFLVIGNMLSVLRDSHIDLISIISAKYRELIKPGTVRISKVMALDWFNIYEPRTSSAINCVLVGLEGKDFSSICLHNFLDLVSTKALFERCRELKWI